MFFEGESKKKHVLIDLQKKEITQNYSFTKQLLKRTLYGKKVILLKNDW